MSQIIGSIPTLIDMLDWCPYFISCTGNSSKITPILEFLVDNIWIKIDILNRKCLHLVQMLHLKLQRELIGFSL